MGRITSLVAGIAVVGLIATAGATAQVATPTDPAGTPLATPAGAPVVEIVLEPRPGRGTVVDDALLDAVRQTLERRLALLGVEASTVEIRERRVVVALPEGAVDPEMLLPALSEVGLLELIDPQGRVLEVGTLVTTSLGPPPQGPGDGPVYETIADSTVVEDAVESILSDGLLGARFRLGGDAANDLFAFTSANIGQPIAIVLDKRVVTSPIVQSPISNEVVVSGLTPAKVRALVVQLRSVPLPVPLVVVGVDGTPVAATPVAYVDPRGIGPAS